MLGCGTHLCQREAKQKLPKVPLRWKRKSEYRNRTSGTIPQPPKAHKAPKSRKTTQNSSIKSCRLILFRKRLQKISKNQSQLRIKDRKSTRLNSSHVKTSYAVFCLKKKRSTPQ